MAFRPDSSLKSLLQSELGFAQGSTLAEKLKMQERMMESPPPDPREIRGILSPPPATQAYYNPAFPGVHFPEHPGWSAAVEADVQPGIGNALAGLSRALGEEIDVTSGYRVPAHNRAVQGAKRSQHLHRNAADINMAGWSTAKRQQAVRELTKMGITNFITYANTPNMLHIDMRKRKSPQFLSKTKKGAYVGAFGWLGDVATELRGKPVGPSPSFPEAPSGPTGWPTPTEKGPGIYGALNPATLAEQYGLANTRYRQPVAATPLDQFRPAPAVTPPSAIAQTPVAFGNVPMASGIPESASQLASPSEALQVGAPSVPSLAPSAPFSPAGPYATAAVPSAPASAIPSISPAASEKIKSDVKAAIAKDKNVRPQFGPPAPAPAAALSAYPEEGRFSFKKGLTPAEREQMGLAPAQPAPTEVKEAPVKEVRQQETIATTPVRTVAAPTIAPAPPAPEKPGGLIGALENLVSPLAAPFHTLANIAGPVPNPPSRSIGYGAEAIGSVLSGQAQAGDTAYSKSMPGYSVKDLGNGMVQKTNPFGHVSFEHVDKPGGIFSGQPQPGGLLGGFGMPGLGQAIGGFFGGTDTAPSSGGGLFGGWGGGGTSGGKSSGSRSSGGRGSMSAGSGGLSHSTRY